MTEVLGKFPATRLRRFRAQPWTRELRAETALLARDLVLPVFVKDGEGAPEPIETLPGVSRQSIEQVIDTARQAYELGLQAMALFPVTDPKLKSEDGQEALNSDNLVCRTIRAVKAKVPEIGVIADVALDPYTSHGHDGLVRDSQVANDETVDVLAQQAVLLAKAGSDVVAPSDMMDGRVGAIRTALEGAGHTDTIILSYAAKYASSLYGPFRDAVGSASALKGGSKLTYQMDPRNREEALSEVSLDISEGADAVMIKPALAYLDVIAAVREQFPVPVFAYHVSGECAMVKAAGAAGVIDADAVMFEHLLSIKRAGAGAILSYAAIEIAQVLKGSN